MAAREAGRSERHSLSGSACTSSLVRPLSTEFGMVLGVPTGDGVLVVLVQQQPLLLAGRVDVGAHQHEPALQLLAVQVDVDLAAVDGAGAGSPRRGDGRVSRCRRPRRSRRRRRRSRTGSRPRSRCTRSGGPRRGTRRGARPDRASGPSARPSWRARRRSRAGSRSATAGRGAAARRSAVQRPTVGWLSCRPARVFARSHACGGSRQADRICRLATRADSHPISLGEHRVDEPS